MLIDDVFITIKAGNGGNGSKALKRNAQTAKGGPDGGNGGNGGHIYIAGSHNVSDLGQFQFQKKLIAEDGISGQRQNLFGRNGKDLTIFVPIGTVCIDKLTSKPIEIDSETQYLIASGGRGGQGNNAFKSATNQTPRFAESGEIGEEKQLHLILKIIADIGLIGLPNAGKSSILRVLTNALPKIGSYPFTTIEPNLGMLQKIVIADIPGLIEGASQGKGLGIQFLKHIEKTKLLVHCIDASDPNPLPTYHVVRDEFGLYNKTLLEKPELILLTKVDLVDEKDLKEKIKSLKKTKHHISTISIYNEKSIADLKQLLHSLVSPIKK